jgi:hypothetical protein
VVYERVKPTYICTDVTMELATLMMKCRYMPVRLQHINPRNQYVISCDFSLVSQFIDDSNLCFQKMKAICN